MALSVRRLGLGLGVLVLAGVAVLAVAGLAYSPNTDIPPGLRGERIELDGVPLRVWSAGSGRDVLLIHGSPGSIEDWEPVVAALGGAFRITVFDRPGHGYSGDTGKYAFEDNADVALRLVEERKLENVVVVGHSYGGTTALAMAARHPARVAAYVVVDSAAYTPSRTPTAAMRAVALPAVGLGFATTLGARLAPRMIREGLNQQFASRVAPEAFVALRTRIWATPKVTHAIALETLESAANLEALRPKYPSIRAKVFLVAQAGDPFRRGTAERLHREIPGSSLDLVDGTGHYVQFEKTERVVDAIRRAAAEPVLVGAP